MNTSNYSENDFKCIYPECTSEMQLYKNTINKLVSKVARLEIELKEKQKDSKIDKQNLKSAEGMMKANMSAIEKLYVRVGQLQRKLSVYEEYLKDEISEKRFKLGDQRNTSELMISEEVIAR